MYFVVGASVEGVSRVASDTVVDGANVAFLGSVCSGAGVSGNGVSGAGVSGGGVGRAVVEEGVIIRVVVD